MYYIYALTDERNYVLYIGVTNNLERRMKEHREALIPGFTQYYNLHKLVYYEEWMNAKDAIKREKQLKHWTRAKKDALIATLNPKWEELMPY